MQYRYVTHVAAWRDTEGNLIGDGEIEYSRLNGLWLGTRKTSFVKWGARKWNEVTDPALLARLRKAHREGIDMRIKAMREHHSRDPISDQYDREHLHETGCSPKELHCAACDRVTTHNFRPTPKHGPWYRCVCCDEVFPIGHALLHRQDKATREAAAAVLGYFLERSND